MSAATHNDDSRAGYVIARETLTRRMGELGIGIDAKFVPWDRSRGADDPYEQKGPLRRHFHYRVTVTRAGRPVLTTDYSMGIAHSPTYRAWKGSRDSIAAAAVFGAEVQTGKTHYYADRINRAMPTLRATEIRPDPIDVFACLLTDASVMQAGGFEDWAADLGYDPDSRTAEGTYRACLATATKLHAALGGAVLDELIEVAHVL